MKKVLVFNLTLIVALVLMIFNVCAVEQSGEVVIAEDFSEFMSLVSTVIDDNKGDLYNAGVEVDIAGEGSDVVNGTAAEIESGKAGIRLYSALGGRLGDIEISVSQKDKFFSVDEAQELGLEVNISENTVAVSNPFATKRLVVRAEMLEDTFGAVAAIGDGEGLFVLQYESISDARAAFERLTEIYTEENVGIDSILKLSKATSPMAQESRNRKAAERIESDRYAAYLKENNLTQEITVAIIDSGVDATHPFLKDRISDKSTSVVEDGMGSSDVEGHGTHIAGIIADNTPDNVKIMSVRCFYEEGLTTELLTKLGINYAVENGAEVINLSFGGSCNSNFCVLETALKNAYKADVVCVAAAGNENQRVDQVCPAKYDDWCITVGSVNDADVRSAFSNYGANGKGIDLVAPGENIWSTVPVSMGSYAVNSGTSMASAFASAAAAMVKLYLDDEIVSDVDAELKKAVVDLGEKGLDNNYGAGVLDFGVLLGDKVEAESISIKAGEINYYRFDYSHGLQPAVPEFVFEPADVTDKSVTVEYLTDLREPYFDGYKFSAYPERMKDVNPVLRFTTSNGKSCEYTVNIIDGEFWQAVSSASKGTGSYNNPKLIETAAQLNYYSKFMPVNSDPIYIKLVADIDLAGKSWTPITYSNIYFDGNGHTISNLTIKDYNSGVFTDYAGLFAENKGEIKNLKLTNVNIDCPSSSYVGAICAVSSGSVRNCYVSGTVNGKTVGGIVGKMSIGVAESAYGISVADCRSDAVVKGVTAGGIVGEIENGTVINCISLAEVSGEVSGGIAGSFRALNGAVGTDVAVDNSKIINCVSASDIAGIKNYGYNIKNRFTPVIDSCYCVSEAAVKKDYCEDTTACTVVSADSLKDKSFYTSSEWNDTYSWDMENSWKAEGDYPIPRAEYKESIKDFYSYIDLGDSIKITRYEGVGGPLVIPSEINSKPVKYIGMDIIPEGCKVTSVVLPDTVEFIGAAAFLNDNYISSIHFGKNLKTVDSMAFGGCASLGDVVFPESVEEIGNYAFMYASTSIIAFEGEVPEHTGRYAFSENLDGKMKIYYIKDNTSWSTVNLDSVTAVGVEKDEAAVLLGEKYVTAFTGREHTLWLRTFPKEEEVTVSITDNDVYKKTSENTITGLKKTDWWETVPKIKVTHGKKQITVTVTGGGRLGSMLVCFDGNGATSGEMNPIVIRSTSSVNYPVPVYEKTGYRFVGWSLTPDGPGEYQKNEVMTNTLIALNKESATLYAVWAPLLEKVQLSAFASTTDAIAFTWNNVANATHYKVYKKDQYGWRALGTVTNPKAVIKNLEAGTKYEFAVRAGTNVGGNIEWADDYITFETATKAPAPKNVSYNQNNSAIKLTWNECKGAEGYRVYQKTSAGWKNLGTTKKLSATITNLKAGTTYTFAIRPGISTGSGAVWSDYITVTASTATAAPTLKAVSSQKGKVTVSWNNVSGAQKYLLYYKSGNGSYKLYNTYTSAKNLNFSNLKSGTVYTFAVRGCRTVGGKNIYSGYTPVSVTVR